MTNVECRIKENKDNMVYRHPYAGPLNIFETLHFLVAHYDNHMRQTEKLLHIKISALRPCHSPKLNQTLKGSISILISNIFESVF
jgi:hypothetical protein